MDECKKKGPLVEGTGVPNKVTWLQAFTALAL